MLDEQMDDMIRDAASKHHPSYDAAAWDKMEKLLDKHLPQKNDNRKFIYFFLLFLLLGGAAFYGIRTYNGNNATLAKTNSINKENNTGTSVQATDTKQPTVSAGNDNTPNNTSTNASNTGNNNVTTVDQQTTTNSSSKIAGTKNSLKNSSALASNALGNIPDPVNKHTTTNRPTGLTGNDNALKNISANNSNAGGNKVTRVTNQTILTNNSNEELAQRSYARNKSNGKTKVRIAPSVPSADDENIIAQVPVVKNKESATVVPSTTDNKVTSNDEDQLQRKTTVMIDPPITISEETVKAKDKTEVQEKNNLTQTTPSKVQEKKKSKSSIASNFGITFSMGPDISYVSTNKPGRVTMSYGVGLSYTFLKRLTVQSGFYVSKKIYSADSANYHPSGNFWYYYPNMQNIEANCKVYEIPVSLSYKFGEKGKHNWFAGASISSLIMKRETYDYDYKTASGQNAYRSYTYNNVNKHNFSVLGLSGGYQYQVNKNISLTAAPYIKIPLSGIGFGKVKLNSAGIMFTATVKPFAKKK